MTEAVTNILFVCTANRLRSPTAQAVFAHRTDIAVRSAGLDPEAPTRLDEALLLWAEKIYVMENHHREKIRKKFKKVLGDRPIIVLGIPDEYEFMQPELIALLKERLPRYADGGSL